jgi:argininosuccinate lyase
MPFRDAHEVVGKIVMKAIAAGKELEEMDLSEFGEDVYQALTLESTIKTKNQVGGTARETVDKQLTADRTDLQNDQC